MPLVTIQKKDKIKIDQQNDTLSLLNVVFQMDSYIDEGLGNDYHYVWLTNPSCDQKNFVWNNKAGVSWNLTAVFENGKIAKFNVSEDSPYFADGHNESKIEYSEDKSGKIEGIYGPGNEYYSAHGDFSIEFDYNKTVCSQLVFN